MKKLFILLLISVLGNVGLLWFAQRQYQDTNFPQRRDAIVAQCKRNLQDIIAQARQSGSKVLLTTVFPLGKVPLERALFWSDAIAPAIQEVNQFIAAQAGNGVTVLDTFTLLQGESDKIKLEYSRDLLHLNARGYEVLNQALARLLST